jgi:hypothetical protein
MPVEETEGRREDRRQLKGPRALEGTEGCRWDRGLQMGQRAVEGTKAVERI